MERVALSAGRCGSECVEYSVNHENTIQIFIYISLLKYESTIYNSYYIKKTTLILENGLLYNFTTFTKVKIKLWQYGMIFYKCLKDKAMNVENKPIIISLF